MMKFFKFLTTMTIAACINTTAAFAEPNISNPSDINPQQQKIESINKQNCCKDPVKALESKKAKVKAQLKEGKISQEKADSIIVKIDARIKQIKDFNNLTLEQKKEKLTADFKSKTDKRVKEGKLSKEKAEKLLNNFIKKFEKWDGSGYPRLYHKSLKGNKHIRIVSK